ncbi:MAG: FliM/FliN family flagellar motor switch protein [Spirochaetia bacterium]|jgi:flagellar motor switch protein FliN/FliY
MKLGSVQQVKVPAQVVLGTTDLSLGELASLGEGSIIELKQLAGEPVDLVVAGEIVARGEVVVIDENFGFRLTQFIESGR